MNAVEVKACCTSAYASDAARWLLGDSFHPGGLALTSRLARSLGVAPGDTIVDVASGRGTSALHVARETGCNVIGIELSGELVAEAARSASAAGLGRRVRFVCGDAEALPLPGGAADAILCECAFCTFPDKAAAAGELTRVLRTGGRLALSDVIARPGRLPAQLASVDAWVACLAGARPLEEVAELLEDAGLHVRSLERHDDALGALLERVEARLRLARLIAREQAERGLELLSVARSALAEGAIGYGVVIAYRPA